MKHCLSQKHADLNDVSLICVSGSDINEVRTALNNDIINFFSMNIKKIVTAYIRSGTGEVCVGS